MTGVIITSMSNKAKHTNTMKKNCC